METATISENSVNLGSASKRLAQKTMVIAENRLELLTLELQEERDHLLRMITYVAGMAIFFLLAGVAATAIVAVAMWQYSQIAALAILCGAYLLIAVICFLKLRSVQRNWKTLPATIEQLKKDRVAIHSVLEE